MPSSTPAKLLPIFGRPHTIVEQGIHSTMGGEYTYQTIYEWKAEMSGMGGVHSTLDYKIRWNDQRVNEGGKENQIVFNLCDKTNIVTLRVQCSSVMYDLN